MSEESKSRYVYVCNKIGQSVPMFSFHIQEITTNRSNELIRHPVESGKKIFDNKVRQPLELEVIGQVKISDYDEVYGTLKAMYEEKSYKFFAVQTRTELITNLALESMPEKQTTDKWDVIDVTLKFVQIELVSEKKVPSDNRHTPTVKGGNKSPIMKLLKKAANAIRSIFS